MSFINYQAKDQKVKAIFRPFLSKVICIIMYRIIYKDHPRTADDRLEYKVEI